MLTKLLNMFLKFTDNVLVFFRYLANDFRITDNIIQKYPQVQSFITREGLVLLTTVVMGLGTTLLLYNTLTLIASKTLNFTFIIKGLIMLVIVMAIMYDISVKFI